MNQQALSSFLRYQRDFSDAMMKYRAKQAKDMEFYHGRDGLSRLEYRLANNISASLYYR